MRKLLIVVGLAAGLGLAAVGAPAQVAAPRAPASQCMNVPETQCGAVPGCVWLPGFKVANGTEVPGFCRPAPKPLTARRPPTAEQPR